MSKFGACLPLLLLIACGGSSHPPESAKSADSADTPTEEADDAKPADGADADTDKPADDAESADSKPADKKPADKPESGGPKATRSAQDILTAPDVVFLFSFNDSDVKQTADSKCSATSGNDAKKMNQCMAKARKGFDVDGYQFKQKGNKWYWLTLRTKGKVLSTMHKFEIEFGPEKEGSVTFKAKGKDSGIGRSNTPASVTFEVPNDYQIVMNDPKLGKLVYEAKIGILTQ
jgi:hypothetical protein